MQSILHGFQDERLRALDQWPPPPPRSARGARKQTHPLVLLAVTIFATSTLWLSHSQLSLVAAPGAAVAPVPVPPPTPAAEPALVSRAAALAAPSDAPPRPLPQVRPPYSEQAHCLRMTYDRPERGDAVVRCGTPEDHSCCRSSAGVPCYYLVQDASLCDRAAAAAAANGGARTGGEGGDEEDGGGDEGGGDAGEDPVVFDASATSEASFPEPRAGALPADVAARALVPMILVEDGARVRGRLAAYPRFNLTWTRGAPAPAFRAAGWAPSEAQRRVLPERDLKEAFYRTCAVVGSSGNLRRSGYGWFIDRHQLVMRFNGAPAGGAFAADVGTRTTLVLLADVATTDCVDGKSRQPFAAPAAPGERRMDGAQLRELPISWRSVRGCNFYPEAAPPPAPTPTLLFLPKRGGVQRLVEYAGAHAEQRVAIRSDQPAGGPKRFADEVDAQIDAYKADSSHPTSGFNGVSLALHLCETVDIYGFGTQREKYFSPPRPEKEGSQHLYRSELRWLLGLEQRFPGRVRVWP